jgi:hypothetical protein
MTLDLEPPLSPSEPPPSSDKSASEPALPHGTVEPCEFEDLLERAMEILKARRVRAGSNS